MHNECLKGMNQLTEMYSAIRAEIPIPNDPTTTVNTELLTKLRSAKTVPLSVNDPCLLTVLQLIICGQPLSHGVNYTTRDIVDDWKRHGKDLSGVWVLEDGSLVVCCVLNNSNYRRFPRALF